MDRFIQILSNLDTNTIKSQVKDQHYKNSPILNELLIKEFPDFKNYKNSKVLMIDLFDELIRDYKETDLNIWRNVFDTLNRILKALYFENEGTLAAVVNQYRNIIKKVFHDKPEIKNMMYNIGLTKHQIEKRKADYARKVKNRNNNRNNLPVIYIEDVIDTIKKLKDDKKVHNNVVAVLLATGLRCIEILKVSEIYEDDTDFFKFKGLAKNPNDESIHTRHLLGMTNFELIQLINKIRNKLNVEGTNTQISNRLNLALNKYFSRYFPMSLHKARYIYANICFHQYGKPNNIPYETYIQDTLNHVSGETSKSYLCINLKSRDEVIQNISIDMLKMYNDALDQIKNIKQELNDLRAEYTILQKQTKIYKPEKKILLSNKDKIDMVIENIKQMKESGVFMNQKNLRSKLGIGSKFIHQGYKQAREIGLI